MRAGGAPHARGRGTLDPMRSRFLLLLPSLLLVGCPLSVEPTDGTPPPSTHIAGEVRLDDSDGAAEPGGPTFVFRYDCANPPPPTGSGRPVDFLVLPETAFAHGSADFIFPSVPPGACAILTGFVDRDRDFNPFVSIANQATAGDLATNAVTVQVDPLEDGSDLIEPVVGVVLEAQTTVPLDKPAFTITDLTGAYGGRLDVGPAVGTTPNTYVRLSTRAVDTSTTKVENPAFTLVMQEDLDGNGWPDDLNGDGAPDVVWPRVLFLRVDDTDETGMTSAEGPIVLPGVVLPLDTNDAFNTTTNMVLASRLAGLPFDGEQVIPMTELTVVVPPLIVTDLATATTAPIEELRDAGQDVLGDYQIVVMNSTGQTWTVPNELAATDEDQAARFVADAPEEALPPTTLVAGTVTLTSEEPGGDALVTLFDCAAPPPPAGTGSPVALSVIKADDFDGGVGTFSFPTIAADACVIITGYIDRDQDFDALHSITKLPTLGDVLLSTEIVNVGPAEGGLVAPVLDVALTESIEVPLEHPAFTIAGADTDAPTMTRAAELGATDTVFMRLDATVHASPFTNSAAPLFTLVFNEDADGDGMPDDDNGDSVPDVIWPRVLLVKIDPADPDGLETADGPIVLPGVVIPLDTADAANPETNLALMASLAGLPFDGEQVIPQTSLTVAVPGVIVTDLATATTSPIEAVAASGVDVDGDYQVIVMNSSGQTWSIPNESQLFGVSGQNDRFVVAPPDAGAPAVGSVAGSISTIDSSEPGGKTILFRFDCANPPPPEGAGLPLDFTILPESAWADGSVDYFFGGVEPGSCQLLTGFIDRDDDWSGLYGVTAQATAGDFAIAPLAVTIPVEDAGTGLVPELVGQDLTAAAAVPIERPAFKAIDIASSGTQAPTMTVGATPGSTASVMIQLATTDIDAPLCMATDPLFTLTFAPDLDADGSPEDFNGDGLPDVVWPRVLVRKLTGADSIGIEVEEDAPVLLPGIIVPLDPTDPFNPATNLVIQHTQAGLPFDGASVFPQEALTVAVPGLVLTDLDTLTTMPIETFGQAFDVTGEYQVLVMNSSGQTWNVPNELLVFGTTGQDGVFVVE